MNDYHEYEDGKNYQEDILSRNIGFENNSSPYY